MGTDTDFAAGDLSNAQIAMRVIRRLNTIREEQGLRRLQRSASLMGMAEAHAAAMARHDFFSAAGPDGVSVRDRVRESGYSGHVGLALLSGRGAPEDAVDCLISDDRDAATLLGEQYGELGVAHHSGKWILLLGEAPAAPSASSQPPRIEEAQVLSTEMREQVLSLINQRRSLQAAKLLPCTTSAELQAAAQLHAADMAQRGTLFLDAPGGPTLVQRALDAGYHGRLRGAALDHRHHSAGSFCDKILHQPGISEHLLDKTVRDIGVGMIEDRWVLLCGEPAVNSTPALLQGLYLALNTARQQAGAPPLEPVESLFRAAQCHSIDMAQRGYYGTTHPDGVGVNSQMKSAGYPGTYPDRVAPILQKGARDPHELLGALIREGAIRQILLAPHLRHFGAGVHQSHWTLLLGRP